MKFELWKWTVCDGRGSKHKCRYAVWCNLHSQMLLYKTSFLLNIPKNLNRYYLAESGHSPSKPQKPVHSLDLDKYKQAVVFSLQTCQSIHIKRPGHVYDCCWVMNIHIVGIQKYLHFLMNCFKSVTYKNIQISTLKIKINMSFSVIYKNQTQKVFTTKPQTKNTQTTSMLSYLA